LFASELKEKHGIICLINIDVFNLNRPTIACSGVVTRLQSTIEIKALEENVKI